MNPESWGFIGTLVGAIVGASTSIITTRLNSRNAISIQTEVDKNLRNERFRDFQRNNYLEIQDQLSNVIRLVTLTYFEDRSHFEVTKKWGGLKIDSKRNEEIRAYFQQLFIMTERIDNDSLRPQLEEIRTKMANCIGAESFDISNDNYMQLSDNYSIIMKEIGKELRNNY